MADTRIQTGAFDLGAEFARLVEGRDDIGGVGSFVGLVRGPLQALTLEHYPGMTEAALAGIAAEAERRWSLLGCVVVHRVGRLLPGEPIVLVLTAASHRGEALAATEFLIDWLKVRAPFWKKETLLDGTETWVEARESDAATASRWSGEGGAV